MTPPMVRIVSDSSAATSSVSKLDDPPRPHVQKRFFIGPMPQKALPNPEELKKLNKRRHSFIRMNNSNSSEEELLRIIKEHARSFFLHEGGREEDWGENEEQSTRAEMYRRWKESEWGVALRRLRSQSDSNFKHASANDWVGGSFEIGNLAGINILAEDTLSKVSSRTSIVPAIPLDSIIEPLTGAGAPSVQSSELQTQTFVTAPSGPSESANAQFLSTQNPMSPNRDLLNPNMEERLSETASPSSSTSLLGPSMSRQHDSGPSQVQSESPARRPIMKLPTLPSLPRTNEAPNNKKIVHYAPSFVEGSPSPPPVEPAQVLERTGTEVTGTSAGAMSLTTIDDHQNWGNVVLRDRMHVRAYSTDSVNVFSRFDEPVHRVTRDLKYEDWGEFLVVWRRDNIEIYENYTVGLKEWITHHKHLAFIIPLKEARTRLSLYSFVDLTFCITCSPTSRRFNPVKSKWTIHSSKEGSNIFIFNLKSRSRAFDWIWQLWKFRSGTLPAVLDIRVPRLDNSLKIDIPNTDSTQTYRIFSKDNLIALSTQSLRAVPDWKFVVEQQLAQGNMPQLCWRDGSYLDWIWFDDDVEGRPREWAVLCGLALKQLKIPVHLELRLAEHHSAFIHQKDGTRLYEPPAIEGYVDRIKPNTQAKQAFYLVTHDGNLFVLNPNHAHPPTPLGAALHPVQPDDYARDLQKSEVRRGIQQLLDATGVVDLRSILAVRRAKHPVMQHTHDLKEEDETSSAELVASQSDREDVGGEGVLNPSGDRRELRTKRSFELLLKNGHVLRFETYSCMITLEWIEKLQALVHYWRIKHRNDATEEMELAQAHRPLVTPHIYAETDRTGYAESPVDLSSPLPAMGSFFNWCVLEGCNPIIKSGKVYMRQGLHGQYALVDLVLVSEHLVHFRISPRSVLHSSTRKKVHLADAYVCSGYLAAQVLPSGQFNPNVNNVPRRYQDGLETDDPEEDRLFVIWYRKTSAAVAEEGNVTANATVSSLNAPTTTPSVATESTVPIPTLNVKRKIAIFRTRSMLERNAWCAALNSAIEKAVRARKEREQKIREDGGLMDL